MTKTTFTLAALMLASTTFISTAEAGGIRLSFGGPLGSFVAHPNQSSGPGGTARHCAKPSYVARSYHHEEAPVRHVKHAAPKVEVAEAQAPRRTRKPKVIIEQAQDKPVEIKTAKLEDKTTVTDAAPSIFVPDSPPAPVAEFNGTQSTPAIVQTAAIEPALVTTSTVKVGEPKQEEAAKPVEVVKPAKTEKAEDKTEKSSNVASKICRRFSAAIAGLIEIPCGN